MQRGKNHRSIRQQPPHGLGKMEPQYLRHCPHGEAMITHGKRWFP